MRHDLLAHANAPNDKSFADEHIYSILEHKRVIGLGDWDEGQTVIAAFQNEMHVP